MTGAWARALIWCAHAWPPSVISVRPTSTSSEGSTPTAAAALSHHTARTIHERTAPIADSSGMAPAALSMKSPASTIANSSARPQSEAAACGPAARNNSSVRLAMRRAPPPQRGDISFHLRRHASGTPR